MTRAGISVLALFLCGGCSGGSGGAEAATDGTTGATGSTGGSEVRSFELSDGTVVEVEGDVVRVLAPDGRALVTIPEGPVAHTFTETVQEGAGMWDFDRADVASAGHPVLAAAEQVGDEIRIDYADEAGQPGATLTVATRGVAGTTALRWETDTPHGSLAVPVACDDDGSFMGFGEQYNAADQRGEAFTLLVSEQGIGRDPSMAKLGLNGDTHTTYFPMPYFLDARGHGLLLETAQRVEVDLCKKDPDTAWFEVVASGAVESVLFQGPGAPGVIEQLGTEVGRPARPPSWAFGTWIAAQGGTTAVRAEMDALEAANIPASVLWVQDWTGPRMNLDGGFGVQYRWREDPDHYPMLAELIDEAHTRGYRFLAYVNPFVTPSLEHYDEMVEQGLLVQDPMGEPYTHFAPNGVSAEPDLTNPEAREYVKAWLRRMVEELGMDGWMADFGEWIPLDAVAMEAMDSMELHNSFPVLWHALSREVMDELRPDGDWAVFARSGFTGVQAVSQIHWVGDQEATFSPHDGLGTVVPAMINLGLSGVPFVTHDIAGFSGGPSSKELWQRWTELGAFTPIMRTHEGNNKDENWSWESDAETMGHFRRFVRVHDALGPELEALADAAANTSLPMVRHLVLEFPDDPGSRAVDDQYMLGPSLLVAPVVTEGATSRDVYLPPGTWFHVWTGESHTGGQTITVDAPVGSPPVFSRDVDRPDLRAITG